MPEVEKKKCPKCGETKDLTARYFYRDKNSRTGFFLWCKTCVNNKPRAKTRNRIIRNRARHRAVAQLVALHPEQFQALYESARADAIEEDERISNDPEIKAQFGETTPRLRSGRRAEGDEPKPRIDEKWCATCAAYHARGHHEKKEPVLPGLIDDFNRGTSRARKAAYR